VILHTGQNMLAYNVNLSDDIIERAALLQAYENGPSRPISPTHMHMAVSPRSPLAAGFASTLSSPRAMGSPRIRVPFPNLLVQYVQLMSKRCVSEDSRSPPDSAAASTVCAEAKEQEETKPETVDESAADAVDAKPADAIHEIVRPSMLVGALSTVCSAENSRCSTPDSAGSDDSSDSDSDCGDPLGDSPNLIGRASWIYFVDQNKCTGLIDGQLQRSFAALVDAQYKGSGPKEEALSSVHIPTLVRSRIGTELLDIIDNNLSGVSG
jgi:hypothetical protein